MHIFISWSGKRSRSIAEALRDWLPIVLPGITPWMSDTDIHAGSRWSPEIAKSLDEADVGIVCLTRENLRAPWLLFEAGAISKKVKECVVCPYLLGMDEGEMRVSPLSQFQPSVADEVGTQKMVRAINRALKEQAQPQDRVDRIFKALWPDLQESIASALENSPGDLEAPAFDLGLQGPERVEYLTQLLGEQYGFIRTKYHVVYEIGADGSAHSVHTEAIKALNDELPGIEHSTTITTEPENITGAFSVKTEAGQSQLGDVQITKKLTLSTPTRLYYQLMFSPQLKPNQTIEYSYEVRGPAGMFALNMDELESRKLPYDYVSLKNSYPSRRLSIAIVFPQEIRPEQLKVDVWMGDARLPFKKEINRNAQALTTKRVEGKLVAEFAVDYPILDVKYAITWQPNQPNV